MAGLGGKNITKSLIDSLPIPNPGEERVEYWDSDIPGFGLRVSSSGTKTFIYRRRIKGRQENVKIGEYGAWTPDMARKRARGIAVDFDKGISVNAEKRAARVKGQTLDQAFKDYLETHNLRPSTKTTYGHDIARLKDWENKPIKDISREMVQARYKQISATTGSAAANKTARVFRAVYNFALEQSEGSIPACPVKLKGFWRDVGKRRTTIIKDADLPKWYEAVNALDNPIVADYFTLLLYSGLRREEALQLEWETVNMADRTFTVTEEKAKNKTEHVRHMSRQVYAIFERRLSNRENDFVFPGRGEGGYLRNPRRAPRDIKTGIGVGFCPHDLRRTFATIANDTVSPSQIKYLLNHSTKGGDVTAGYIILSAEKKVDAEQRMADAIDLLLRPPTEGNVIPISASRKVRKGGKG